MFRIRYYGQEYHPDHFKRGLLGVYIRFLNWFRWKLELLVVSLTMRYLSYEAAVGPKERKDLRRRLDLDIQASELEKDATSPQAPPQNPYIPLFTREPEGYQAGRHQSVLDSFKQADSKLPMRPSPLEPMASRMGDRTRAKRYARGHRYTVVEGEDGDFIPLEGQDGSREGN